MAAPFPPPKIAPNTAPIAAPPPTNLPVLLFAPSPPGPELFLDWVVSRYLFPLTVTELRSRLVSLPLGVGTATSCAREWRGMATAPELSITSSLTVAVYLEFSAGFAGIEVSVLTLISVPSGNTWLVCANTAIAKKTTATMHVAEPFITVSPWLEMLGGSHLLAEKLHIVPLPQRELLFAESK
jgi:hypothetical protein